MESLTTTMRAATNGYERQLSCFVQVDGWGWGEPGTPVHLTQL